MPEQQEEIAVVHPENDDATKEVPVIMHPSVSPRDQQEYWRWVQLQVLRERVKRNSLRE